MQPEPGWRRVAPVDCIGYPTIFIGYVNDMMAAAGDRVQAGDTLTMTFTRVDGEWRPLPETLQITPRQTEDRSVEFRT